MSDATRGGWLQSRLENPEFRRYLAREEFVEGFLNSVNQVMEQKKVSRAELARRMECKPANVTQIMRRNRNLTASTMVDIAFHLGLQLELSVRRELKLCFSSTTGRTLGDQKRKAREGAPLPSWKNRVANDNGYQGLSLVAP